MSGSSCSHSFHVHYGFDPLLERFGIFPSEFITNIRVERCRRKGGRRFLVCHPQEENPLSGIFEGFRVVSQDSGSVAQCHPEVRLHFERATPALEGLYGPACNTQSVAKVVEALALEDFGNLGELLVRDGTAKIKYLAC